MKKAIYFLFGFLFFVNASQAQLFHFVDSSTTLIKTTDQSPAHWYLEIVNDSNVDYTLRWKTSFYLIPVQWSISFDVQTAYYNPIMDGDSADFLLMDSMVTLQKLIIGNATNGTPGHGSVFFDVYDPANPAGFITIEYEFIITPGTNGVENQWNESLIGYKPGYIEFYNSEPTNYSIISSSGQQILMGNTEQRYCSITDLAAGIYFLYVEYPGNHKVFKMMKND